MHHGVGNDPLPGSRQLRPASRLAETAPEGWGVRIQSHELGAYKSRDTALRVAIGEALQLRARGQAVRVTIDETDANNSVECCICDRFSGPTAFSCG